MRYAEFQQTDFYNWFGIAETGRAAQANGLTRVNLEPGGHQNFINLHVEITPADALDNATLLVDRSFLISPSGINPLGLDITKSFINVTIPDQSIREPLVEAIWNLTDRSKTLQTFQHNAAALDPALVSSLPSRLPGLSTSMITRAQPNAPFPTLSSEILHILLACLGLKDSAVLSAPSWSLTASNESINSRAWLRLHANFQPN